MLLLCNYVNESFIPSSVILTIGDHIRQENLDIGYGSAFRILRNIHDGVLIQKWLIGTSRLLLLHKRSIIAD